MRKVGRILESGHYYHAKGPTIWASVGWGILSELKQGDDLSVLLVDDFHEVHDVNDAEANLPVIDFVPDADFTVMESELCSHALIALEMLKAQPKRRRARYNQGMGVFFCSGFAWTRPDGLPTCLLLDLGFCLWKSEQGTEIVNIIPEFYAEQQASLARLASKILPDYPLTVFLHDLGGSYKLLVP